MMLLFRRMRFASDRRLWPLCHGGRREDRLGAVRVVWNYYVALMVVVVDIRA